MTRPYSDDLRARVVGAVLGGSPCREAAQAFGVSVSCAAIWSKRMRDTGAFAALPMGGARRAVLATERGWLLERMAKTPDVTLRALRAELAERGVAVSLWAVWKVFATEGITFKKKAFCPPSRTAPTSPAAGAGGRNSRRPWILPASSSSMKPGPRPTWCDCMGAAAAASDCTPKCPTGTGKP